MTINREFEEGLDVLCAHYDVAYQELVMWLSKQPGIMSEVRTIVIRGTMMQMETQDGMVFQQVPEEEKHG